MSRKPIGKILKSTRTYEKQNQVLSEWADNWHDDQTKIITELRYAAMHDCHGDIMYFIQQLEGMTEKRFTALNNVLKTVSDPDRVLKRRSEIPNDDCEEISNYTTEPQASHQESYKEPDKNSNTLSITNNSKGEVEALIAEIVKGYNAGMSLIEMSNLSGISENKIVKILVTAGVYTNETYDKIKFMRESGKTDEEIADRLGLGKSAMSKYSPYSKGIYGLNVPSENAYKIRKCRENMKNK